jgi:positive regulator of sigma E activity
MKYFLPAVLFFIMAIVGRFFHNDMILQFITTAFGCYIGVTIGLYLWDAHTKE